MSHTLPASAHVASTALDFILRLVRRPAPAAADTGDVWVLYSMHRGGDSVSPAVLRKLADGAASR
ncbi:hypothetical protein [Massilia consociata]|uniref:Uncharacterized protein n=1 Tax=Massilia consociata TaxID=760117 RepID=A0ABV6FJ59_9BURK